jgi:hypothetical protein
VQLLPVAFRVEFRFRTAEDFPPVFIEAGKILQALAQGVGQFIRVAFRREESKMIIPGQGDEGALRVAEANQRQSGSQRHAELAGKTKVVVAGIDVFHVHDRQTPGPRPIMPVQLRLADESVFGDEVGIEPIPVAVELNAVKMDFHPSSDLAAYVLQ